MEVLKFHLRGAHAFFKIPEVNSVCYFTYGQIHKPALLGLFGAVLGYQGYGQEYQDYPEYYERLKELRVSVMPDSFNGYFARKIQSFNNSVGYASQEQGGNLVVKEQWLEQPGWTIFVLLEGAESQKLADALIAGNCEYMPYLGKNDHPADISEVAILPGKVTKGERVDSLFPYQQIQLDEEETYTFKYEERLPMALKRSTNQYITERMVLTDGIVEDAKTEIYCVAGKNIVFY